MNSKRIAPENLSFGDRLGEVFKNVNIQHKYFNFPVLHARVREGVLQALTFDAFSQDATYYEVTLDSVDHFNPQINQAVFSTDMFAPNVLDGEEIGTMHLDYNSLLDSNLLDENLILDSNFYLHLFGRHLDVNRRVDVNNSIKLQVTEKFEYPGQPFVRLETTSYGKRDLCITESHFVKS